MAKKRMISLEIIDTDKFLDLPVSTQALYMHLICRADDDGFVGNPKKIAKSIGASDVDLNLLCSAEYIIPFESGIIVITHFQMQNALRNDRYKPTIYREEKNMLIQNGIKKYVLLKQEEHKILRYV